MRSSSLAFVLLALPFSFAACGSNNESTGGAAGAGASAGAAGTGGAGGAPGLPCDVAKILATSCQSCHSAKPVYGAPMPLVTYDDLHAPLKSDPTKKVYERISLRIHDDKSPMPPPPNERLGAADTVILDNWVQQGAPKGTADCGGAGSGGTGGTGGAGGVPLSCTPDVKLQPATPWVMPKDTTDEYVCYGVDVPVNEKRHIIALAPLVDNPTIVHHMLLFAMDQSVGSTPVACSGGMSGGRLVGVWAPGGGALELPAEAGYAIEGTAHFALQVHYSNLMHLDGEKDSSGYQLCTTNQLRPNDADILAFGTWSFTVPAQGSADITCDFPVPVGAPITHGIAGMPHMHKLGTKISTTLIPGGGGATVDLGTADPWNFESQIWTPLDETAVVKPGDTVRTRCAWDNPTSSDVHFGETTASEMCFGFYLYYPRISFPGWSWGLPAFQSKCAPTQ